MEQLLTGFMLFVAFCCVVWLSGFLVIMCARTCLLAAVPDDRRALLASFIRSLVKLYIELNFVYLEINPLVITDGKVCVGVTRRVPAVTRGACCC